MTLWALGPDDTTADGTEVGRSLRALHETLRDYPGELPPFTYLLDLSR